MKNAVFLAESLTAYGELSGSETNFSSLCVPCTTREHLSTRF